ncbi:MAG: class I SAM-dependent methyltransferase [Bacteroidetes bacterium]|nr:class I SAM-dependent methyltransferase [Bacteroidota bacterium]
MTPPEITEYKFKCNICENDTHKLLYVKRGFPITKCTKCGLVSTVLPNEFDTHKIYDDTYFHGGQIDGYSDYKSTEKILKAEFHSVVKTLLPYFKGKTNLKLLEIGSAYGYFLDEASKYFDCYGIEINQEGVDLSNKRGHKVFQGELTDTVLKQTGKLDVVVMLDVIEHLTDPYAIIKKLYDHMNPGGIILIVTGNHDSMLSNLMAHNWRLMTPPQHTFFFSVKTLKALVKKAGFEIRSSLAPWKTIPLGLAFYQIGSRTGIRIKSLEKINSVGVPVNLFDTVRIIAEKV